MFFILFFLSNVSLIAADEKTQRTMAHLPPMASFTAQQGSPVAVFTAQQGLPVAVDGETYQRWQYEMSARQDLSRLLMMAFLTSQQNLVQGVLGRGFVEGLPSFGDLAKTGKGSQRRNAIKSINDALRAIRISERDRDYRILRGKLNDINDVEEARFYFFSEGCGEFQIRLEERDESEESVTLSAKAYADEQTPKRGQDGVGAETPGSTTAHRLLVELSSITDGIFTNQQDLIQRVFGRGFVEGAIIF